MLRIHFAIFLYFELYCPLRLSYRNSNINASKVFTFIINIFFTYKSNIDFHIWVRFQLNINLYQLGRDDSCSPCTKCFFASLRFKVFLVLSTVILYVLRLYQWSLIFYSIFHINFVSIFLCFEEFLGVLEVSVNFSILPLITVTSVYHFLFLVWLAIFKSISFYLKIYIKENWIFCIHS